MCVNLSIAEVESLENSVKVLQHPAESLLLASFGVFLSRLTQQEKISISAGGEGPLTFEIGEHCSFLDVLAQRTTRPRMTEIAVGERAVHFGYIPAEMDCLGGDLQGLRLTVRGGGLQLEMASASERWSQETLGGWIASILAMVEAATKAPETPVRRLPMWSLQSASAYYEKLNRTQTKFDGLPNVVAHFAYQASHQPDATAVRSGTKSYTYRELDQRSTEIAQHLVAAGAGPDRAVAVCMERSVDLLSALLAVLKSGSFYVPLDPHNPAQRLRSILEECLPVAVLTDSRVEEPVASTLRALPCPLIFANQPIPRLFDLPSLTRQISPDDLAYAIYTSGTTGKPKGVRITHRALMNLIHAMWRTPGFKKTDLLLAVAPISFDIATMDMFLPICAGGSLVIASREEAIFPFRLARLLKEYEVTVMQATPATWRMMVTTGWKGKANLKMLSGGEALPRELANELTRLGGELWNLYGPTETTIYSSVIKLEDGTGIVPLGRPMANTSFYVMDETGCPVPSGIPGELYIGGMGVSTGYLNLPELTAQRFVPDTFSSEPGQFLFRTGDLVRLLSDGTLEFFGRLDHQVKLRGFRIELGEIESVLRTHPSVSDAVTVLRHDAQVEPRLVSYVTGNDRDLDTEELRQHAATYLPDYMLPARIVWLDKMPLSTSGKIDRLSLPTPERIANHCA
jgi:polyketide synthase PksJ